MYIKNKALREAYNLLENEAPLGNADCGELCGAVCCTAKTGDSMELFPGEKELFEGKDGFEITKGEISLLKCSGSCDRRIRPFACRIYPLFPLVDERDGKEVIRVIYDPRATAACPLCKARARLDRRFTRAVRRAGKYLLADPETAEYLRKTSEYLKELIEFEAKLNI